MSGSDLKSIKLHSDTLAALRAVKTRHGGTYDSAIDHILKRQAATVGPILNAAAQLDRIETLLLEIRDQFESPTLAGAKTGGAFVVQ